MTDNSVQIQEVQVIGESVEQPTAQEGGQTLNREQSVESLEALLQRAIDESVRSQRNLSKAIAQLKESKRLGREPCPGRHGRCGHRGRHHKPITSSSSSNSSESETEGAVVRHQHHHGHGCHDHRRGHHGGRDRSRSRGRSRGHSRGHSKTRGFHGHGHKHFPVSIVV